MIFLGHLNLDQSLLLALSFPYQIQTFPIADFLALVVVVFHYLVGCRYHHFDHHFQHFEDLNFGPVSQVHL